MKRIRYAFTSKRLPSSVTVIIILIGSVIMMVLDVMDKLSDSAKLTGILTILTFSVFSEALERILTLSAIESDIEEIKAELMKSQKRFIKASEFTSPEKFLLGGEDIRITGLTKAGTLSDLSVFFIDLLKRGSQIKFILLDPSEANLYHVVNNNLHHTHTRFQMDIKVSYEVIGDIRKQLTEKENERLKISLFNGSPGFGMIAVNPTRNDARMQLYFYPYMVDPRNRPGIEIYRQNDPKWFDYFIHKYDLMWNDMSARCADPTLEGVL